MDRGSYLSILKDTEKLSALSGTEEVARFSSRITDNAVAMLVMDGCSFRLGDGKVAIDINGRSYSADQNSVKSILGKRTLENASGGTNEIKFSASAYDSLNRYADEGKELVERKLYLQIKDVLDKKNEKVRALMNPEPKKPAKKKDGGSAPVKKEEKAKEPPKNKPLENTVIDERKEKEERRKRAAANRAGGASNILNRMTGMNMVRPEENEDDKETVFERPTGERTLEEPERNKKENKENFGSDAGNRFAEREERHGPLPGPNSKASGDQFTSDRMLFDFYTINIEGTEYGIYIAPLALPLRGMNVPVFAAVRSGGEVSVFASGRVDKPSLKVEHDGQAFVIRGSWNNGEFNAIVYPQRMNGREYAMENKHYPGNGDGTLGHYLAKMGRETFHVMPAKSFNNDDGHVPFFLCREFNGRFEPVNAPSGGNFRVFSHSFDVKWEDGILSVEIDG